MRYPYEFNDPTNPDNLSEYSGYIMFRLVKSESTQTDAPTPSAEDVEESFEEEFDAEFGTDTPTAEESRQEGSSFAGANAENQSTAATTVSVDDDDDPVTETMEEFVIRGEGDNDRVELYLPPGLQYRDNVLYDTVDLALLGTAANRGAAAALSGMGSGGIMGMAGSIMNEASNVIFGKDGVIDSIKQAAGSNLQTNAARYGMAQLANMIPNAGVQGAVRGQLGVGANPNSRVLFNKVSLREFAFTFKLIARSEREANEIARIVKFFRKNLYPETFDVAGLEGLGYKFPKAFKIDIDYGGSWKPPQLKECYLRDVNTTMNASTMAILPNGAPLEVDLSLSFVEGSALSRQDVDQEDGY